MYLAADYPVTSWYVVNITFFANDLFSNILKKDVAKFVFSRKWLGGAGEKANFSRRVRVRFVVGLPHQKAGVPVFCVWPVLFRVPSPTLSESAPGGSNVAREQRDVVERVLGWAQELTRNPSLRRADIARREGVSRARVSQLMKLARVPAGRLKELRESKHGKPSVRELLKISG